MRSRCVIVDKVSTQKLFEMEFIEYDDMVEALASNSSDESLNIRILPRSAWGDEHLSHVEGVNTVTEDFAKNLIAMSLI